MNLSPKHNFSSRSKKREENLSERPDYVLSHQTGSDILSVTKKFLKPIMNPLFSWFQFSPRSPSSDSHKTSHASRLYHVFSNFLKVFLIFKPKRGNKSKIKN